MRIKTLASTMGSRQSPALHGKTRQEVDQHRATYRHRKIIARYRRLHPLCQRCLGEHRQMATHEIHHILPIAKGGTTEDANLLALCSSCHETVWQISPEQQRFWKTLGLAVAPAAIKRTLVCGPPGSGKTTYVEQHMKPGDLVWDWDHVANAIFPGLSRPWNPEAVRLLMSIRALVLASTEDYTHDAWIIVADPQVARELAQLLTGAGKGLNMRLASIPHVVSVVDVTELPEGPEGSAGEEEEEEEEGPRPGGPA